MAEENWIESIYTLTTLPSPLSGTNGRIQGSAVSSLNQGKKRKRSEIATAIDGEGINIHALEDSNLITSYAVPPDTFFDTPPYSLFCKRSKQDTPRRLTYATSRSSVASEVVRLSCYEAASQDTGYSASKPAQQTLPSGAKVVFADILPGWHVTQEEEVPYQVLTLQKDRTISSFDQKLSGQLWSTNLSSIATASDGFDLPEDFEIRHAELVTLEAASQGILSGRQDVVSALAAHDAQFTYVLAVIGSSASVRHTKVLDVDIHIYALKSSRGHNAPSAPPQQLLSWSVPHAIKRKTSHTLEHHLDSKSGSLIEVVDGKIISYDLKGLSPKIIDKFGSRDRFDTVIRLSPSIILSCSAQKLAVYDSKFGSELATQALPPPAITKSKKGKTQDEVVEAPTLHFVDFFKRTSNVVAMRGTELLVIQMSQAAKSTKRGKTGTLLVDSLSKGKFDSRLMSTAHGDEKASKKRKKTKIGTSALFTSPELDMLLEEGNVPRFEKQFSALVNFTIAQPAPAKSGPEGGEVAKPKNVSHNKWYFPTPGKLHRQPTTRAHALYALSKLFAPSTPSPESIAGIGAQMIPIEMKFYAENVFLWLVHTGQLRADIIQRALNEYHGFDGFVMWGDVVQALAAFVGDLSLVNYCMEFHANLHVDEIVLAVKLIVNNIDEDELPQPEHKLLLDDEFAKAAATTGATTGGVGIGIGAVNGDVPSDIPMFDGSSESKQIEEPKDTEDGEEEDDSVTAALQEVDELMEEAYENLEHPPLRGETLRQAFTRLNALPQSLVTPTLRKHLTHHEIIFLIHILRIELDQGGWTTRYSERGEIIDEPSSSITVVANALSRTVDAVGMQGWLTTSSSNPVDGIDQTMTLLRGEISNTLEGVHEATFIAGVLGDFLRYGHRLDADTSAKVAAYRKGAPTDEAAIEPTNEEKQLWAQGKTTVHDDVPDGKLPMALGADQSFGVRTVPKDEKENLSSHGQGRKRTRADVGREVRRGLPPYVFERIRF